MFNFFTNQLDYIYFIYGISFVVLSVVIFHACFQTKLKIPLLLLGIFSAIYGLAQWFYLAQILFKNAELFAYIRAGIAALAMTFLFEFGRKGLIAYKVKVPGKWIFIIIGIILCAGSYFGGHEGFHTASNYLICCGALTAAAVFIIAYRYENTKKYFYLIIGVFFILGSFVTMLEVPGASFFPASVFNEQSFVQQFHIPIQFCSAVLIVILTIIFAIFLYEIMDYGKEFHFSMKLTILYLPITGILAIVIGGWALTNYVSNGSDKTRRHSFIQLAIVSSYTINSSQIASLTGTSEDSSKENYKLLKKTLMDLRRKLNYDSYNQSCRFAYLLGKRDGRIFFYADSEPEYSEDMSPPGEPYNEASVDLFNCFTNGQPFVEGPMMDKWGYWVSGLAPIRDRTGKTIALLGLDADAREWCRNYAFSRLIIIFSIMLTCLIICAAVLMVHILTLTAAKRLITIEALEKSEEKYKTLVENLNVGIYSNTIGNGKCFTEANTALARLLGFETVEEFRKTPVLSFYRNPVDRYDYIKQLRKCGFVKNYELLWQKKDGTPIVISLNAQAYFNEEGQIKSIFGVIEDITERKKTEENIKRSRETLNRIIDSMPFGVTIVDKNKKIRLANKKAIEMTGNSDCAEVIGKICHNFICPSNEGHCPVLDMHQKVDLSEKIMLTKDKKRVPILKSVTPIIFDNEEVLLESFVDISERKQAEGKMKELNKELEEANEELKNFAYIASHDLREPLRKITAFGGILEKSIKEKIDGEDSENLHFMIDGAKRMTQMIDGLLCYSRVSSKGHGFEDVDVNIVVNELKQYELGMLLEETHTVVNIPEPLPMVHADMLQMRQLIQNLIANGIKYQKKGSAPEITITSKMAADNMVRIEITDNGIGIAPEYHNMIFVMFKRLHRQSEYDGTGIGLSVCKKIVQRHNGLIGVESEQGKG
ncbi:MAG TPA: hypothetical protein DCP47_04115, partial [Phycisphaerales bacterium]|nr:hypothetical protein [Phycisphaerales bacterium]